MFDQNNHDDKIDKQIIARNAAIARLARFIEKYRYNTDWTLIADAAGVGHILDRPRHERVRSAQNFGDPDYAGAIARFLKDVFDNDESVGQFVIGEIVSERNYNDPELTEESKDELGKILTMFDGGTQPEFMGPSLAALTGERLIDPRWVPDYFYQKLIDETNQAYVRDMPFAATVLIRKLLENLVIDILRAKYGTAQLNLYYDPSRRRFHDFAVLLRNLDDNKSDFHHVTTSLNDDFIRDLNEYRETGNAGAHSIDADITIDKLDKVKLRYLVELLLKVLRVT